MSCSVTKLPKNPKCCETFMSYGRIHSYSYNPDYSKEFFEALYNGDGMNELVIDGKVVINYMTNEIFLDKILKNRKSK